MNTHGPFWLPQRKVFYGKWLGEAPIFVRYFYTSCELGVQIKNKSKPLICHVVAQRRQPHNPSNPKNLSKVIRKAWVV